MPHVCALQRSPIVPRFWKARHRPSFGGTFGVPAQCVLLKFCSVRFRRGCQTMCRLWFLDNHVATRLEWHCPGTMLQVE